MTSAATATGRSTDPADHSSQAVASSPATAARIDHSSHGETCSPRRGRRDPAPHRGRGRVASASSTPASRPTTSAGSHRKTDASANMTTLATTRTTPRTSPS